MDDKDRRAYDSHMDDIMVQNDVLDTAKMEGIEEGRAEGRVEGLKEGRAEGIAEAQKSFVKNLHAMGLPVADIQRATGLSEQDIEDLLRE